MSAENHGCSEVNGPRPPQIAAGDTVMVPLRVVEVADAPCGCRFVRLALRPGFEMIFNALSVRKPVNLAPSAN